MLWNSKKPEIMNKKQMQIASQISKRKALHPPCAKDEKKLQRYYEGKIAVLPDVFDVTTAVDLHTLEAQYPQLSGIMVGRGMWPPSWISQDITAAPSANGFEWESVSLFLLKIIIK